MKYSELGQKIQMHRVRKGMTRGELAARIEIAESTLANYELGKVDFAVSHLIDICNALQIDLGELENGPAYPAGGDGIELMIYNLDDRLKVADILIKNGYTVAQGKKTKTPTGKQLDYFLRVQRDERNADTSR